LKKFAVIAQGQTHRHLTPLTPVSLEGHKRAADQAEDWNREQQNETNHHEDHEDPLPSFGGAAERSSFWIERRLPVAGRADLVLQQRDEQGDPQLDHREQPGNRQVEAVHRLVVDFHLDSAELRTSEHQYHPKTGEIEQENQQRSAQQRGNK